MITLSFAEADDAERERRRNQMGEPYRTLLGHFRHEIGPYFGLEVHPRVGEGRGLHTRIGFGPRPVPFDQIIRAWLPLTFALNSLNRSIGQPDAYPFILSAPVVEKLGFIHKLVHRTT